MSEGICKISDQDKETWSFSVVDVIGILTEQSDVNGARNCWKVLKNRLTKEGSQVVTNCSRLKLTAQDGILLTATLPVHGRGGRPAPGRGRLCQCTPCRPSGHRRQSGRAKGPKNSLTPFSKTAKESPLVFGGPAPQAQTPDGHSPPRPRHALPYFFMGR